MDFALDDIKAYLKLKGVPTEDLSDKDLEGLINLQLNKIEAETGRELHETKHEDYELHFKGCEYNLKFYPVVSIETVTIDNKLILPSEYLLDPNNGIIKFKKRITECELLEVTYSSKESDYFIQTQVMSLMKDMLFFELSKDPAMSAASISEGDVSINYDVSNSLNVLILKKLDKLRVKPLTRML